MTTAFAPAGAVTGIGALPASEPSRAVSFVAKHSPDIPFSPGPPQGRMTDEVLPWRRCFGVGRHWIEEDALFLGRIRSRRHNIVFVLRGA